MIKEMNDIDLLIDAFFSQYELEFSDFHDLQFSFMTSSVLINQ